MRILLDTNVALWAYDAQDPNYARVDTFLQGLPTADDVFICPQIVFELRVVLTRPTRENGFGQSAKELDEVVANLRKDFQFLADPDDLIDRWLRICDRYGIIGKQSHDARLVAWMEAYSIDAILTLNPRHFAPFESIEVLMP